MNPLQENIQSHSECKPASADKENQEAFRQMKLQFVQKMSIEPKKKPLTIQQCVQSQIERISFQKVISGNICEEELQFANLTDQCIQLSLNVVCYNQEYDPLEEYVYSARKLEGFDYNDKIVLTVPSKSQNCLKIALKAPNDKENKIISGEVFISASGNDKFPIQGVIRIPIDACLETPSISCNKMLYSNEFECQLIPLAFKQGKKMECKIPFKNNSPVSLSVECSLLDIGIILPYEITTSTVHSSQSQGQFFVQITLKPKSNKFETCEMKQVLTLKIKNSSMFFGFPLLIKIC